MKRETLKQRFERKRTLAVYADSAFTGIGIVDYESGIDDSVFFFRQNADGTKKYFKRKIESEYSDENGEIDFFFKLYGQKYFLRDFMRV